MRDKEIQEEFERLVNMRASELEDWLETDVSQSVGQRNGDGEESIGHASGRRIAKIKRAHEASLSDEDYRHMSKVVAYIKRHSAQRPDGDISDTRWRYSLMNWGHDPLKD